MSYSQKEYIEARRRVQSLVAKRRQDESSTQSTSASPVVAVEEAEAHDTAVKGSSHRFSDARDSVDDALATLERLVRLSGLRKGRENELIDAIDRIKALQAALVDSVDAHVGNTARLPVHRTE
jgi:hypothetical protein